MFSCLLVATTSRTQFFLDNHITGLGMRGRGLGGGGAIEGAGYKEEGEGTPISERHFGAELEQNV